VQEKYGSGDQLRLVMLLVRQDLFIIFVRIALQWPCVDCLQVKSYHTASLVDEPHGPGAGRTWVTKAIYSPAWRSNSESRVASSL